MVHFDCPAGSGYPDQVLIGGSGGGAAQVIGQLELALGVAGQRAADQQVPGPSWRGAVLIAGQRGDRPKSPGSGLIPVTLGEVRRLMAHLTAQPPARSAALAWSTWRRRHQHRAKASHYQRRQANYNEVLLEY